MELQLCSPPNDIHLSRVAGTWLFADRSWLDPADIDDHTALEVNYDNLCLLFPTFAAACRLDRFLEVLADVSGSWQRRLRTAGTMPCISIADFGTASGTMRIPCPSFFASASPDSDGLGASAAESAPGLAEHWLAAGEPHRSPSLPSKSGPAPAPACSRQPGREGVASREDDFLWWDS